MPGIDDERWRCPADKTVGTDGDLIGGSGIDAAEFKGAIVVCEGGAVLTGSWRIQNNCSAWNNVVIRIQDSAADVSWLWVRCGDRRRGFVSWRVDGGDLLGGSRGGDKHAADQGKDQPREFGLSQGTLQ